MSGHHPASSNSRTPTQSDQDVQKPHLRSLPLHTPPPGLAENAANKNTGIIWETRLNAYSVYPNSVIWAAIRTLFSFSVMASAGESKTPLSPPTEPPPGLATGIPPHDHPRSLLSGKGGRVSPLYVTAPHPQIIRHQGRYNTLARYLAALFPIIRNTGGPVLIQSLYRYTLKLGV